MDAFKSSSSSTTSLSSPVLLLLAGVVKVCCLSLSQSTQTRCGVVKCDVVETEGMAEEKMTSLLTNQWEGLKEMRLLTSNLFEPKFKAIEIEETFTYDDITKKYMDIGSTNASFLIGSYSRSLHLATNKLALTYLVTSHPPSFNGLPLGSNMASVYVAIETKMVVDLLERLSVSDVLVIYDSMEGWSLIEAVLERSHISIGTIKVKTANDVTRTLSKVTWSESSNFVVMATTNVTQQLLARGIETQMIREGQMWIVANLELDDDDIEDYEESGANFVRFKLQLTKTFIGTARNLEQLALQDGLLLMDQLIDLNVRNYKHCQVNGTNLPLMLSQVNRQGATGELKFDKLGRRTGYLIDMFTISPDKWEHLGTWNSTSSSVAWTSSSPPSPYPSSSSSPSQSSDYRIDVTRKNKGKINSVETKPFKDHLKVVSILDAPFLMYKPNFMKLSSEEKYEGHVIDLLHLISAWMNFTFEIYLVPDGKYGLKNKDGVWNGIVQQILEGKASMSISAMSVTKDRDEVLDFTIPFSSFRISALGLAKRSSSSTLPFTDPLSSKVWIGVLSILAFLTLTFHLINKWLPAEVKDESSAAPGVMVVESVSRMERMNENESKSIEEQTDCSESNHAFESTALQDGEDRMRNQFKIINPSDKDDNNIVDKKKESDNCSKFSSSFFFTFSTFLLTDYVVARPEQDFKRSLSARLLSLGLRLSSVVLVVAYAAKMAAMMTSDQLRRGQTTLEELLVESETRFGTVRYSEISHLIETSPLPQYKHLWQVLYNRETSGASEIYSIFQQSVTDMVESQDEGVDRIRSSRTKDYYFLWHSQGNKYHASIDSGCELESIESSHGGVEIAIAVPKHSELRVQLNAVLLKLKENGLLEDVDNRWWGNNGCLDGKLQASRYHSQLCIKDFLSIFIFIVVVVILSFMICIVEANITRRRNKARVIRAIPEVIETETPEDRSEEIQESYLPPKFRDHLQSTASIAKQTQIF